MQKRNILIVFLLFTYAAMASNDKHINDHNKNNKSLLNSSHLLHLQFDKIIEDKYIVDVYWLPDDYNSVMGYLQGPAIIHFQDTKDSYNSFSVSVDYFSLSKETTLKELNILLSDGTFNKEIDYKNHSFILSYDSFDKTSITDPIEYHTESHPVTKITYASDRPFFFEDVDFDNQKELIIVEPGIAQRFRTRYTIYKQRSREWYNLSSSQPFVDLDSESVFNKHDKTIINNHSGGAKDSCYIKYKYISTIDSDNKFKIIENTC